MMILALFWLILATTNNEIRANPDAKRLYDDLLSNYDRLIRPVSNHTDKVTVKLGLRLSQLVDLNLKDQILTTNVWLEHEWKDHKFSWDPSEYGGVTEIYVPSEHIWLPDIILYNNADGDYIVTTMTKAILHYDGKVIWTPPAIFKSSCEVDVEFFPFDQQSCFLKFGSWTFDGFQVDLIHINSESSINNTVSYGMDLSEYYLNGEWDIISVPAERHVKTYPCCPEPYPDIYFRIIIRRKPLFYVINLIIPCVGIFYLSILVFYMPAQSGEKTALITAILLSQTLYFNLVIDVTPATSITLPLLGKYLVFSTILISVAIMLSTIILNLHYRKPSTHRMPTWVRKLFIQNLPKVLCMNVPLQGPNNPKKSKNNIVKVPKKSFGLLTKVSDSINQTESISTNSSGSGEEDGVGGNLRGHLNGLYGGFTQIMASTVIGGVEAKKKLDVPFVVQKAMHNIMFIKHHIKRQDEFDEEDQNWGIVAMVLDRLFLYIFGFTALVGSSIILTVSPYLYDDIKPIDTIFSKISTDEGPTSY